MTDLGHPWRGGKRHTFPKPRYRISAWDVQVKHAPEMLDYESTEIPRDLAMRYGTIDIQKLDPVPLSLILEARNGPQEPQA